jgi:hypothetical protein
MAAIALWAQALHELTKLYFLRHDVIPQEQDLFYSTVEAHLKAHPSTSGIHNWLCTHHPLVVLSMKEVICRTLQGVRSIATYDPTAPPLTVAATQLVSMPPRVPSAPPRHGK